MKLLRALFKAFIIYLSLYFYVLFKAPVICPVIKQCIHLRAEYLARCLRQQ